MPGLRQQSPGEDRQVLLFILAVSEGIMMREDEKIY